MRYGCVDIFCGVGGLSIGLQSAGIEVALGVDVDAECAKPFEQNTGSLFYSCGVEDLDANIVQDALAPYDISILAGCAPCQPFSTYTQTCGIPEHDHRWHLLDYFSSLVASVRPDFVTIENVAKIKSHPVFKRFLSELHRCDYNTRYDVISCEKYGIPQTRRRLVLVASREVPVALPEESSSSAPVVREVIGSLRPIAAGTADPHDSLHCASKLSPINLKRIQASKPGGRWDQWPEELIACCHTKTSGRTFPSVYGRMEWDKVAPTITGQCYGFGNGRFGHPEQDRAISLREAALLQTFPTNAQFTSPGQPITMKRVGQLIGNAVPPKLGEAIGRSIVNLVG